jgi:16S rRNA (guanine527-N7)-methyltransferase
VTVVSQLAAGSAALGLTLPAIALDRLAAYAALVLKWNRIVNLTGAASPEAFVAEHLVDCLALVPHVTANRVADIGSGAGLPGLVLAIAQPDTVFWLVEPRTRRTRFLEQARIELGLANVTVVRSRVETWVEFPDVGLVLCRAYGPLERVIADTRALQRPGVRLMVYKGADPTAEIASLPQRAAFEVIPIHVPGRLQRHLAVMTVPAP